MRFTDAANQSSGEWRGVWQFAVVTAITLAAEFARRLMPPPRKRHRMDDEEFDDE